MEKKGQAAMEFLMTYGWAILAAIIVIAILAIYFRPSTLVSSGAVLTAPLYAVGATVSPTQVQLEIRNNGGENLELQEATTSIDINTPSGALCTVVDLDGAGNSTFALDAGATQVITFEGSPDCTGLTLGDTVSADVTIGYRRPDSTLDLTSTGSISGSVQ